jgi:hypothetical protein
MAKLLRMLLTCFLVSVALSVNEDSSGELVDGLNVDGMSSTFARSEEIHQESMAAISKSLSLEKAVEVVRNSSMMTPALAQVADMALAASSRKQPKGYAGVEGAKKMLNDMIYEAMLKYDEEIAKCTSYYAAQCAAMEVCRGQIAAANYIAANSRALILDASLYQQEPLLQFVALRPRGQSTLC